jgi:hypothetical protein
MSLACIEANQVESNRSASCFRKKDRTKLLIQPTNPPTKRHESTQTNNYQFQTNHTPPRPHPIINSRQGGLLVANELLLPRSLFVSFVVCSTQHISACMLACGTINITMYLSHYGVIAEDVKL